MSKEALAGDAWKHWSPETRKQANQAIIRATKMRDQARAKGRSLLPAARVGLAGIMVAHQASGFAFGKHGWDLLVQMVEELEALCYSWELTEKQRIKLEKEIMLAVQKPTQR